MERTGTPKRIRVAAELEPDLVQKIDEERSGSCSRETIVRMALIDRYKKISQKSRQVA